MTKRAGKRKTGLDVGPELAEAIGEKVIAGWSLAAAAEAMGVNRTAIYNWLDKGTDGREPYAAFADTLKRALAEARGKAEENIYRRVDQWQASARWLESMDPKTWRRTERREVTQTSDIRVAWPDLAPETPDALKRRCASIDEALAEGQGQAPSLPAGGADRQEEPRRLAALPKAVRASLPVAVNAAQPQERKV